MKPIKLTNKAVYSPPPFWSPGFPPIITKFCSPMFTVRCLQAESAYVVREDLTLVPQCLSLSYISDDTVARCLYTGV